MFKLSDQVTRKYTDVVEVSEWSIDTDTGWQPIEDVKVTVEYELWTLTLENGMTLECADDHIVFDDQLNEIFVKDLRKGDLVSTKHGLKKVVSVVNNEIYTSMFDIGVDSDDHRFYTNDILSHNSTIAAAYLLWYAMFVPDSTILIASNKYANAMEIGTRIRYGYENIPDHIRAGVKAYNKGSLEFDNGSRIILQATTENTGRGLSSSLVYLDEMSFCRKSIQREMWTSLSPTIATGGKIIITTTPAADDDMFSSIWRDANDCVDTYGNPSEDGVGKNGFKALKVHWTRHPDRDDKWAAEQRAELGELMFRRELDLEFIRDEETLIDQIKLNELIPKNPIAMQGHVRWYKHPTPDYQYVLALDPSLGTGGDYAAIQVFELPTLIQVAEWQHNKTPIKNQVKIMREILEFIYESGVSTNDIYYSVENNSIGEATLLEIANIGEENIRGYFISESKKNGNARLFRKGFNTTNKVKLTACAKLKNFIETDKMKVYSANLIAEMKNFVSYGASYAAKPGDHDDLVMSVILVIRIIQKLQLYDTILDRAVKDDKEYLPPMPFIMVM